MFQCWLPGPTGETYCPNAPVIQEFIVKDEQFHGEYIWYSVCKESCIDSDRLFYKGRIFELWLGAQMAYCREPLRTRRADPPVSVYIWSTRGLEIVDIWHV